MANALDEAWTKTEKSGEENGLFAVWDGTNNMVHVITVPQGTHTTTRHGSIPSLDIVGPYKEFIRKLKGPVRFITEAHTHPDRYDRPSGYDIQPLYDLGGADGAGMIITGVGRYSLYGLAGRLDYPQRDSDKCRTPNVRQPSVHVRFIN